MGKKQVSKERSVVVAVAALPLLAVPVMEIVRRPSLDDPPARHSDICPALAGQPLGVLASTSMGSSPDARKATTTVYERYTAYDPSTGETIGKTSLGSHTDTSFLECMAMTRQHVWVRTPTDGVHVRDSRTGAMVKDQKALFGGIAAPVDKAWFDPGKSALIVATKDGRNNEIKPETPSSGKGARWIRDQDIPTSAGNLFTATSQAGGGSLARRIVFVGNKPLADTDWLNPVFGIHPGSGTIEWPNPPSLVICEPTETDKPRRQLTRVTLDGTILWTYTPGVLPARTSPECDWQASGDGSRLVLLTEPNGMIGIDAATGRETYRRVQ